MDITNNGSQAGNEGQGRSWICLSGILLDKSHQDDPSLSKMGVVAYWLISHSVPRDHHLALNSEFVDAEVNNVTGVQVNWIGLLPKSDSRRRASGNNVTGTQRHEFGQICNQRTHPKDHGACISRLHAPTIHLEPHSKILRVTNVV
jgi:hypothetical protein